MKQKRNILILNFIEVEIVKIVPIIIKIVSQFFILFKSKERKIEAIIPNF